MIPVFLDTSGLIALVNTDDQWHELAQVAWKHLIVQQLPLVTTSLVLNEIGDGLAKIRFRKIAIDLYDRLKSSPQVDVMQATPADELLGWELFRQRDDKEWGITDCISIVIMQRMRITDVFSADRDFEQAGFSLLLRPMR